MSTRKKKIILDCDLMKYPHSGLYHYCLNLGLEVKAQLGDQAQGRIAFYVPPGEQKSFGPGAECIPEKRSFWQYFNPFLRSCDIWHAPFQSGRIIPDKRKYPHIKVVLTIHDLNPLHEGKSPEEQRRSLALTQSLVDRADAIVCISSFCRSDVLSHCQVGNKPVHVIHNGIHKVHPPALHGNSYKPIRPFLFGMGYVNTKKNYHVLLPLLENKSIEMVIAGRLDEPAYIEKMKHRAIEMGVADRVHLLGPVTEPEKGWYFENCMAFVHPSLAEGFGAPVVEAMQFGKPLFLSALTSLPEIAGDVASYFTSFEPLAMQRVFREGMMRHENRQLAERVRQRARQFDWKEKAKEYLKVYESLY